MFQNPDLLYSLICRCGSFFYLVFIFQVIDWLPTLLSAAGFDMTKLPKKVDGIDMWQTLNANTPSVRTCNSTVYCMCTVVSQTSPL